MAEPSVLKKMFESNQIMTFKIKLTRGFGESCIDSYMDKFDKASCSPEFEVQKQNKKHVCFFHLCLHHTSQPTRGFNKGDYDQTLSHKTTSILKIKKIKLYGTDLKSERGSVFHPVT